jgi:hypothetical protein
MSDGINSYLCDQVGVKGSNEDERAFARLAASQANVTLLELPMFADSQRMDGLDPVRYTPES